MKNKTLILTLAFFLLIIVYSQAQKRKSGLTLISNSEAVINANKILYYGWDFSNMKFSDGTWVNKAEELRPRLSTIVGLLSSRFTPAYVTKYLNKEVEGNLDVVQKLYTDKDPRDFVTFNTYEISVDSLHKFVKAYDLPQTEGIGLVIIAENMNKEERYTTAFVTFFDLETRELLWVTKMKGLPGSKWGFSKYWYEGFVECFYYFLKNYYPQND